MRKTKAVIVEGTTYVVRELTALEVDALFDQSIGRQQTTVDGFLDVHGLNTVLLGSMMDVPPERCAEIIGNMMPSEYRQILDAAKELNPDFFEMARRHLEYAGQIAAINELLANRMHANASGNASASSSSTDTTRPGTTA
nr:hypothetical protein [uncultured Desulfobulbus sp.]